MCCWCGQSNLDNFSDLSQLVNTMYQHASQFDFIYSLMSHILFAYEVSGTAFIISSFILCSLHNMVFVMFVWKSA